MDEGDPRGYVELPRGAWVTHRALLAPQLDGDTLTALVDAYNEIVEWNEVLWAAFASRPPESFHGSDQHRLDADTTAVLLRGKRTRLDEPISAAAIRLRADLGRLAALTERDVRRRAA